MSDVVLDDVDRKILMALQEDARGNTNADIAEQSGVSPSTVSKRITKLEEREIITGYRSEIDYELTGFPINALLVCSTPITERESLVEDALEMDGVIHVRELMTGQRNVHVEVVGRSADEVMQIARELAEQGLRVEDEAMIRNEYRQPCTVLDGEASILDAE